jgi:hypothetical protein
MSQRLDTASEEQATHSFGSRLNVHRPGPSWIRLLSGSLSIVEHPEANVALPLEGSHGNARRFRVKKNFVAHFEVLVLRNDALDVLHRDPHESLQQLVGIESRPSETKLDKPRPHV